MQANGCIQYPLAMQCAICFSHLRVASLALATFFARALLPVLLLLLPAMQVCPFVATCVAKGFCSQPKCCHSICRVCFCPRQVFASVFCHRCCHYICPRRFFPSMLPCRFGGWAKFGSTFFPHIFVWGSCFWFCIPPPPFLVATVSRQEIRSIFAKISLIFDKNRPYFLTGNDGNQKLVRFVLKGQACAFLVAIVARQKIRSIFVKNKAYFGKNRPYFLTGRWAAAWAKFGSTFFPHIFVWGSCFWFCIPPPPFLVAIVARQKIKLIFVKFLKKHYLSTGNVGNQKTSAVCLERTSVRVFGCHRCPSKKLGLFLSKIRLILAKIDLIS